MKLLRNTSALLITALIGMTAITAQAQVDYKVDINEDAIETSAFIPTQQELENLLASENLDEIRSPLLNLEWSYENSIELSDEKLLYKSQG